MVLHDASKVSVTIMAKRSQGFSPSGLTPRSKFRQRISSSTTATRVLFPLREKGGAQHQLPPEWSHEEEEALLVHMSRQVAMGIITGWPAPRTRGKGFWENASEAVSAVSKQSYRSGKLILNM